MKEELNNIKNILPDFFWRALQMASKQSVTFVILMLTAKLLTPEKFGVYNYIIAFTFLFTLIADFGISRAITKFTAEYKVKDESKINSILFSSALILLSITAFLLLILFIVGDLIVGEHFNLMIYLLPVFIFLPLSSLFDGLYSGLMKFKKLSKIAVTAGIISIISSYFLIRHYQIIGSFLSIDLYYFLLFTLLFISYKNYSFKFDKNIFKEIYKYSLIIGVSSLGQFLYSKAIVIILGKYNYFTEAGYYELIDKIFLLITVSAIILGQIIAPKITRLHATQKNELVYSYYKKTFVYVLLAGTAAAVILYFILPVLLQVFLNKYYTENFLMIFNLMLIQFPLVLLSAALAQPFVIGTGNAKYSLTSIPFGILNVVLALILVNTYGFIGAIIGLLFVSIMSKITVFYLITNKLKV